MTHISNLVSRSIWVASLATLFAVGCKDKDKDPTNPIPVNPQELITTVTLTFTDMADTTQTFEVKWRDADGPGSAQPVIDTLRLDTSKTYKAMMTLTDETKNPDLDITEEVEEEAEVHQVFYTLGVSLQGKVTIQRQDLDNNGLPLGLQMICTTSTTPAPVVGTLQVVLSHYDGIPKTTNPSPESDVDITFPVVLK